MEISTVHTCQDTGFKCETETEQCGVDKTLKCDRAEETEHRGRCIRYAHCESDSPRQEMGQVENNVRYFQTMLDELTGAKEQLRVASPAEREVREMLLRIGGEDPDERSKHGVPRQQDLTKQQPPTQSPPQKQQPATQSSSQSHKQVLRKNPRQQQFHPEPAPQVKQDAPRQEPVHERQESRPNQEPQQTPRQKQRVRMQEDSPTVDDGRGKRPRVVETGSQKMETDQVPESELPPVPEDDDVNATVSEVVTDVEVLLDGSSVIDVFVVNSA